MQDCNFLVIPAISGKSRQAGELLSRIVRAYLNKKCKGDGNSNNSGFK